MPTGPTHRVAFEQGDVKTTAFWAANAKLSHHVHSVAVRTAAFVSFPQPMKMPRPSSCWRTVVGRFLSQRTGAGGVALCVCAPSIDDENENSPEKFEEQESKTKRIRKIFGAEPDY